MWRNCESTTWRLVHRQEGRSTRFPRQLRGRHGGERRVRVVFGCVIRRQKPPSGRPLEGLLNKGARQWSGERCGFRGRKNRDMPIDGCPGVSSQSGFSREPYRALARRSLSRLERRTNTSTNSLRTSMSFLHSKLRSRILSTRKTSFPAGLNGDVPVPMEKRFLIL